MPMDERKMRLFPYCSRVIYGFFASILRVVYVTQVCRRLNPSATYICDKPPMFEGVDELKGSVNYIAHRLQDISTFSFIILLVFRLVSQISQRLPGHG